MDYFKSNPLRKWNKDRIKEYFTTKGLQLTPSQLHSGATFCTARLSTLRRIYGNQIGEKIYLIIRDRIEREEDILYKKSLNASPMVGPSTPLSSISSMPTYTPNTPNTPNATTSQELLSMSDLDLGSPIIQSGSPIDRVAAFPPPQLNSSSNIQQTKDKKEEPLQTIESQRKKEEPLQTIEPPRQKENQTKYLDIKETDARAKRHFELIESEHERRRQHAEDYLNRIFIEEHPPLLWQPYHLQYLLKSLGLPTNLDISVDDFIFLTQEELEKLYPNKGEKLYLAIKSKFVNPSIKKIPIKKYPTDC